MEIRTKGPKKKKKKLWSFLYSKLPETGPSEGTIVMLPLGLGMLSEISFPAPERCWYGRQQVSGKCPNPKGLS